MKYRGPIGLLSTLLLVACSSDPIRTASTTSDAAVPDAEPAVDARPAADSAAMVATDVAVAPPADAAPTMPAECVEKPLPRPGTRPIVTFTVDLTYEGKPVVFGEPFRAQGGGYMLTLSNFRFFVSEIALRTRGSESVPVDLVATDGKPVPYNVHLVHADDQAAMTFRIAAPPGDYVGSSFLLGISDACNRRDPDLSQPPLTPSSQMTWPPPFGYLFLRYEGNVVNAIIGATAPPITAIAMGGIQGELLAPRVTADGVLQVTSAGGSARLRMALDQLFAAAALPANLDGAILPPVDSPPGGPPGRSEIEAGEHVRQNASKVPIFSLTNGP